MTTATLPAPPLPGPGRLLLASNSPRRRELLALIVPQFETAVARDIDESYPATLEAHDVAAYLSRLKADAYRDILVPGETIITADTVVIAPGGAILGKPADADAAAAMLRSLSGAVHRVITGVTLTSTTASDTFACTTEVTFDTLAPDMIDDYIERFRPFDKAGAYGIQEWIGCVGISKIDGCFYNVMGLPLHDLNRHLRTFLAEKKSGQPHRNP